MLRNKQSRRKRSASPSKDRSPSHSPVTERCQGCSRPLPPTRAEPFHPMCGECTVKNNLEHFGEAYQKVKCSACRNLNRTTYNDYLRRANFFRKHKKWFSIPAIRKYEQGQANQHSSSSEEDQEIEDGSSSNEDSATENRRRELTHNSYWRDTYGHYRSISFREIVSVNCHGIRKGGRY